MKTAIILAGPEKAGKSTLANLIWQKAEELGLTVAHTHFSGREPVTAESIAQAKASSEDLVLWDRAWACGQVYKTLGFNQLPEAILEEGESFGSEIRQFGVTAIIYAMPPTLQARRTKDDLPITPRLELEAYLQYGAKYGWQAYQTGNSMQDAHRVASMLLLQACSKAVMTLGRHSRDGEFN